MFHVKHPLIAKQAPREQARRRLGRASSIKLNAEGGFHVKHLMPDELRAELLVGLAALGVTVTEGQALQCVEYLLGVLAANNALNLTRISDPGNAVRLHLLDSLAALPEVGAAPAGRMLDIGTGGGFPGVPMAIASGRDAVLLDSVAKKAAAVEEVLRAVGLPGIEIVSQRAEAYACEAAGGFAVVLARAVAPLPSLLELGAPFLCESGRLVLLKGRPTDEEIGAGDRVARIVGVQRSGARAFSIPDSGERRTVLTYERIGRSSVALPRRDGLAQRRPLA
jgi:16S rRNA (guanine527-N7)-methyltransferase